MHNTKNITTIAMFVGIVVVLQIMATFINFGAFPITLTLIPIIVGGAMYGPLIGTILGTAFGVVVAIMVITGADPSGAYMLSVHPFITIIACVLKGSLAGFVGAYVYQKVKDKNQTKAVLLSSALVPIVNTGTLALVIIIFFDGSFATLVALFMTINFVLELVVDLCLATSLLRIINKN